MDVKGLRTILWVLVGIGCVLTMLSGASIGAVADGGHGGGTNDIGALVQEAQTPNDRLDEADEIHIDVNVHENGSATFVVDYRFENNSEGTWESLRNDVEANPDEYTTAQAEKWNETLAEGENATDRDMAIRNVSVTTDTSSAPRDMGHVTVTFDWDSFAYVELNRVEVEHSLAGFTLSSDTSLQVFAPENYRIEEASPSPEGIDDESAFWVSDGDPFSSDPPQIVMIEERNESQQSTEPGTDPESDPEPGSESETGPSMPWAIVLAALALLVAVGTAGWWVTQEHEDGLPVDTFDTASTDQPMTDGSSAEAEADADTDGPPPELLSNEERVLRLLEKRGGRIKQQEVVSELDWTEAKTSQVVSGLREDDEIEVFRIGRENVLSLPDEDESI